MNLMINDRNHPKELFSTNNTGIPWEEACKVAYSREQRSIWARHSRKLNTIWALMWASVTATFLLFVLSCILIYGGFHVGLVLENTLGAALVVLVIADFVFLLPVVALPNFNKIRKYYAKLSEDDQDGYWDSVDSNSGYTNFSMPMIIHNENETFLCVHPRFAWEPIGRTTIMHSLSESVYGWKVPIPSEVMFSTPERQQEFLANRKDTQIRLLTARVVYATQQIEWLDRLAFEKAPEIVVDEQGWLLPAVLDDYRACKNWYEKYRDENIAVLHGVIEKKLADRKSMEQQKLARENIVREKMGITV